MASEITTKIVFKDKNQHEDFRKKSKKLDYDNFSDFARISMELNNSKKSDLSK